MLATSREALGLVGEMLMRVPSLSLPPDPDEGIPRRGLPPLAELADYESVLLFVERARYRRPGFSLTPQNAPHIARLCRTLDGMPLAIELAAARTSILSPEEILTRLDHRFSLLTEGQRAAPTRHRTLRGAIDWSYSLLDDDERALLRRLSVFAGTFSLAAVVGICSTPDEWDEFRVIDLIASLSDKSLLSVEETPTETRYRLLDTIRQYASEKLEESGESRHVRDLHLSWHLALAERARPELQGPNQKEWLDRLQADYANIRVALAWEPAYGGDPEHRGLRLAEALGWFWYVRGYLSEGKRWLENALLSSPSAPLQLRAKALYALGFLIRSQANYVQAIDTFEQSLELFTEVGDKQGISDVLNNLAVIETNRGNYSQAEKLFKENLELQRELDNRKGMASTLNNLGYAATVTGDYLRAREYLTQSLILVREFGNMRSVAIALNNLGQLARKLGEYTEASSLVNESLSIKRQIDDRIGIASSLNYLGEIAWCRRNYAEAKTLCAQSLEICRELDDKESMALALANLGEIARAESDYEAAHKSYVEAMRLAQEVSAKEIVAAILYGMARLVWQQRERDSAFRSFMESLTLARQIGAKDIIAECLLGIAEIARTSGLPDHATVLLGIVEHLLRETGYKPHPNNSDILAGISESLRSTLGVSKWRVKLSEGSNLSIEAAIALVEGEMLTAMSPQTSTRASKYPNGLTRREVDVLILVARGLTDAEIANRLIISPNTVHAHIHSIYGKLDVTARAAAIRFALDHKIA
jgi:predicted ATPase/DNA-binding CsgD family transcriptional regulator